MSAETVSKGVSTAGTGTPPDTTGMGKFEAFWVSYLWAHSKPATRACHYVATLWGTTVGLYGLFTLQWPYLLAGILGGYAIAVGSHYAFEGRAPLVARSAWMGAVSDFRVIFLAATGKLAAEYRKYGLEMRG